jgi:signal transduction histidine kinase
MTAWPSHLRLEIRKSYQTWKYRVADFMLDNRWLIVIFLCVSTLIFEALELLDEYDTIDAHFFREVIFFGFVLPLVVGFILNLLVDAQKQRSELLRKHQLEEEFTQEITKASSKMELCKVAGMFLKKLAPVVGVTMLSYADDETTFVMKGEWWTIPKKSIPPLMPVLLNNFCCNPPLTGDLSLKFFQIEGVDQKTTSLNGYCLALFHNRVHLGYIQFYLPDSSRLQYDQVDMIERIAPVLALAMEGIKLKNRARIDMVAVQHERQRIARSLHDNLGQNLAYLRMNLDRLSTEYSLSGIGTVHDDLERMRFIANEAYEQMRETLDGLSPEKTSFTDTLFEQLQTASELGGMKVNRSISGDEKPLPTGIKRKVHAIVREAVNNVIRHAQAKALSVNVVWEDRKLTLVIEDDGCGFDPNQELLNGHYGLMIMQQRAEEINGSINVYTQPERGTRIELEVEL